jgi:hypothetical protein
MKDDTQACPGCCFRNFKTHTQYTMAPRNTNTQPNTYASETGFQNAQVPEIQNAVFELVGADLQLPGNPKPGRMADYGGSTWACWMRTQKHLGCTKSGRKADSPLAVA